MTEATTTTVRCARCRRALKSAKAIAAGMGAVCLHKTKAEAEVLAAAPVVVAEPAVADLYQAWMAAEAVTHAAKVAYRNGEGSLADVTDADEAQYAAYRRYAASVTDHAVAS